VSTPLDLLSFTILTTHPNELPWGGELQGRRLKKAIVLLAFVVAYMLLFIGSQYLWYLCYQESLLSARTEYLAIVLTNVIMFGSFVFYRHCTREKWLAEEAKRWLAARKMKQTSSIVKRRKALWRGLLCVPYVIVSLVSLFVPEAIGVASHLGVSRTAALGNYQVHIPNTWFVGDRQDDYLWVMTVPGVGRIGFERYWRLEVPLSEMTLYPVPHPEEQLSKNVNLAGETVLARRTFALGNETLTCWDLIHNNPFVGSYPTDPSIADISCTTETDHFYVHFLGWRRDSAVFYETLQRITLTN
jgi:hypothetical protein